MKEYWRIHLVLTFIILFGAAITGRLIFLQIFKHDFYKVLAKGQQKIFDVGILSRGELFLKDRAGNLYPLAVNKSWPLIYVCPQEIQAKVKTAQILSEILNLDKDLILRKLNRQDSLYQLLKKQLSQEEVQQLREKNLAGVYLKDEVWRYYPQENFASPVIGFLGGEGVGQYGIEGYYNDVLEKGQDIVLTLDYNIQFQAERLLEASHKTLNFEEGQILVIEPKTGKIKTLAHFPNFNPNRYWEVKDMDIFQNALVQKIFEPGSVFKTITMAAALEEQKVSPETFYDDKGYVKIGGYVIYNYNEKVWGKSTMTQVLEKSINTGAVFAESQLGHSHFLEYLEKFAIFEPTDIDLQGEFFSKNLEFKKGYEINFATASFGQGIEMTPLQLARAYCVIANGGELVKPYIAESRVLGSESAGKRVISQKTASQLTAMLCSAVKNGFAKAAQVPGYYIAGKTGTAQIPWSVLGENRTGYSDKTVQTFIGFFPAFDPQFIILVKLNNPAAKTAEYSATPIFQKLAKYIIDYWQIPPDYE